MAYSIGQSRPLIGCQYDHKPCVVGSAVDVEGRIGWIGPVVQREKCSVAKRSLSGDGTCPDAGGEQRGRDVGALAAAFALVKRRDDCRIQAHRSRMITAA